MKCYQKRNHSGDSGSAWPLKSSTLSDVSVFESLVRHGVSDPLTFTSFHKSFSSTGKTVATCLSRSDTTCQWYVQSGLVTLFAVDPMVPMSGSCALEPKVGRM